MTEEQEKENILEDLMEVPRRFLKVAAELPFNSIIDMGGGPGHHARYFQLCGKDVTHFDFVTPIYDDIKHMHGDFTKRNDTGEEWDAIWSHHALEHVHNVIEALICWNTYLKEGGYLLLSVPAIDNNVSKGHVVSFNIPLLMYLLSGTGFDCSDAYILRRFSHIQFIVKKKRFIDSFPVEFQTDLLPDHVNAEIADRGRFSCDRARFTWIDGSVSNIRKAIRVPNEA